MTFYDAVRLPDHAQSSDTKQIPSRGTVFSTNCLVGSACAFVARVIATPYERVGRFMKIMAENPNVRPEISSFTRPQQLKHFFLNESIYLGFTQNVIRTTPYSGLKLGIFHEL